MSTPKEKMSHLTERIIFMIGTVFVFYAQFFIANSMNQLKDDQEYLERVVNQVQLASSTRDQWLAQYNSSVASIPQNKGLLGMNAFKLYTSTDQLLTLLETSALHEGKGSSQSLVDSKNERFNKAEELLKVGNIENLVALVNAITSRHDKVVENSTKNLMQLWQSKRERLSEMSGRHNLTVLMGVLFLSFAFLMREYKDYKAHNKANSADAPKGARG